MIFLTYMQDCIVFKYTVYLAPSSVNMRSVCFLDGQLLDQWLIWECGSPAIILFIFFDDCNNQSAEQL